MKEVKILSLGTIISQNVLKAVNAYADLFMNKQGAASTSKTPILQKIGAMLQEKETQSLIDNLKLGSIDEASFTEQMIAKFNKLFGIELTVDEFNQAWNSMNPSFEDFQADLNQVAAFNREPDSQVILHSFTNPIDMGHLAKELKEHSVNYKLTENGELVEIDGMKLYTTYVSKTTKADLLQSILQDLKSKGEMHIEYVTSDLKEISNQTVKESSEKSLSEVKRVCDEAHVDMVFWDKKSGHSPFDSQKLRMNP